MGLMDIYRVFHPAKAQYTFFSKIHGTFSNTVYILGHKASLKKYKKTEIIPCMLSNHSTIKVEFNNKENRRKYSKT
jgi:exonuclease III